MRCAAFLLVFMAVPTLAPAQDKRKPNFTIGKDTTYITSPLDKDGYPDYETALNQRLSEGITPDNNANVLFFKALGPHPDGAKVPDSFFKWLKVPAPPAQGDYFVNLQRFAREHLRLESTETLDKQFDVVLTRPWTAKEHPDLAAWLKLNEKPLALVVEAARRPAYFYPILAGRTDGKSDGLFSASLAGVQAYREFGSALAMRALLRVADKKYDDAWQDLLACHRLARHVGRGATLIEGLVGVAVDSIASRADLAFLEAAPQDGKTLRRRRHELETLPPLPLMADKVGLGERFFFLETVAMVDRHGASFLERGPGGKSPPAADVFGKIVIGGINWDPAMRNANALFTRMATAMKLRDRTLRSKHMHDIDVDMREMKASLFDNRNLPGKLVNAAISAEARGKIVGDVLISLLVPALMKVQQAGDRIEQVHIAFALAIYKADEGRYPKDLAALTPKYLAEAPLDPFSGKALIYRVTANGYFFYSVGVNGKDEEGRSYDDEPPGDDLPVRMPAGGR
jgi:hypothetical protein